MDCSPPGFSVYGILQAKVLEWVAILFSRVSSHPRDWTQVSSIVDRFFPFWATREAHICIAISLSIHPFTDTCFHILATVNNAAVNLIMQIYFSEILLCFNISRHICWITWKLLFFFFLRNSILFSIVTVPLYIPTNSAPAFPFLQIFPTLISYLVDILSNKCEVMSHCGSTLHFPDD